MRFLEEMARSAQEVMKLKVMNIFARRSSREEKVRSLGLSKLK